MEMGGYSIIQLPSRWSGDPPTQTGCIFSDSPPAPLRLWLPVFPPFLVDAFGVKDLRQVVDE